jgi:hypothetical protein
MMGTVNYLTEQSLAQQSQRQSFVSRLTRFRL